LVPLSNIEMIGRGKAALRKKLSCGTDKILYLKQISGRL
jgi:hypothetical protein